MDSLKIFERYLKEEKFTTTLSRKMSLKILQGWIILEEETVENVEAMTMLK